MKGRHLARVDDDYGPFFELKYPFLKFNEYSKGKHVILKVPQIIISYYIISLKLKN